MIFQGASLQMLKQAVLRAFHALFNQGDQSTIIIILRIPMRGFVHANARAEKTSLFPA